MEKCLVGTGRFELPTPRTPSECSTRLSHVPTAVEPAVVYSIAGMRRAIAVILLFVFGSFVTAPLLAASADPDSNLPGCCRRLGVHHCMTRRLPTDPATQQISASPEKCPMYPRAALVIRTHDHSLPPNLAAAFFSGLQSHPACHAQTKAQRRISLDRSHQKRGPPLSVLANSVG